MVSAIAVGGAATRHFERITRTAGGSVSTLFPGRAPKHVRRTSGIVKHILTLAFGKRWKEQLGAFLRVFDKYRRAKYLR